MSGKSQSIIRKYRTCGQWGVLWASWQWAVKVVRLAFLSFHTMVFTPHGLSVGILRSLLNEYPTENIDLDFLESFPFLFFSIPKALSDIILGMRRLAQLYMVNFDTMLPSSLLSHPDAWSGRVLFLADQLKDAIAHIRQYAMVLRKSEPYIA